MECHKNQRPSILIIIFGLYLHILLLCAIVELHYPSRSIANGLNLTEATTDKPDAKRLVLILADGLRPEAIFGSNSHRVPFLNGIKLNTGSWGRAYSKPPTLERLGHIAILSGTYENPITTIYKSWTGQPIGIDSLLNQSANSQCWGHLDGATLFNSDNLSHVNVTTYSPETDKPYNKWLVQEVENFTKKLSSKRKLQETRTVYLIHMPARNSAGYPIKTGSHQYSEYITNLDKDVESIAGLFKTTFIDNRTSYIFTSVHGMTYQGTHGGDSPFETETPFIAWGAGIKQQSNQVDLNQTDIVPLLATLIGVPIPRNSLGVIPLDYLGMPEDELVSDIAVNALQLSKIFLKKQELLKSTNLRFVPYNDLDQAKIDDIFLDLQMLYMMKKYSLILSNIQIFIDELIKGIDYYQTYHQRLLFISVCVTLLEWILFLLLYTLDFVPLEKSSIENYVLVFVVYMPVYFCYVHDFGLSYYLYISLPVILFVALYPYLRTFFMNFSSYMKKWNFNSIFYLLIIQLVALAFFHQLVLSSLLLVIGLSLNIPGPLGDFASKKEKIFWFGLCLTLAMFTALPRPLKPIFSFALFICGTVIWFYLLGQWEEHLHDTNVFRNTRYYFNSFRIQKLCLMIGAVYQTVLTLGNDHYVSGLSWFLSTLPVILIPFSNTLIPFRLAAIVFGITPFYLLTSTGDELLYLVVYVATLLQWLILETKHFCKKDDIVTSLYYVRFDTNHDQQIIVHDKIRKIFFQFVFLLAGFNGAGTVTNVLFDPKWSVSFLTKPDPAIWTFLVISKMVVPILFACCTFQAINVLTKDNHLQMFCCSLFVWEVVLVQVICFIHAKVSLAFFVINVYILTTLFLHSIVNKLTTFSYIDTAQKVAINKSDL